MPLLARGNTIINAVLQGALSRPKTLQERLACLGVFVKEGKTEVSFGIISLNYPPNC